MASTIHLQCIHFCNDELTGTFFFVNFFYKIYENSTVGNDLKCHIIVTAKMNEFPKRSKASISKQKKQPILKAFNKIKKEITHGDNGNVNT
jgi:hypothetical protein